jgi:hypothetical protein
MSWLDKLLGRDRQKPTEAPTEREGPELDGPAEPAHDPTAARDEVVDTEGHVPPGTGS